VLPALSTTVRAAEGLVHLVSSIRRRLGQQDSATIGYSALETAAVMLAVRLAGGPHGDDVDREDRTGGVAGG
jgi:hypothetical protein